MSRMDLYGKVHKAIRAELFEAALRAARTDFADARESAAAADAVRRVLDLLARHAEHEDAVVMPELRALAPELFHDLAAEHARTDGLQRELERLVERVGSESAAERASAGRRLHDALLALAAEHLRHMAREEREANRVLWAHRSDEELHGLHLRILARIPPAEMATWFAILLPAVSPPEQAEVLAGLRAAVPSPAFEELVGPAREALGPEAWAAAEEGGR